MSGENGNGKPRNGWLAWRDLVLSKIRELKAEIMISTALNVAMSEEIQKLRIEVLKGQADHSQELQRVEMKGKKDLQRVELKSGVIGFATTAGTLAAAGVIAWLRTSP